MVWCGMALYEHVFLGIAWAWYGMVEYRHALVGHSMVWYFVGYGMGMLFLGIDSMVGRVWAGG